MRINLRSLFHDKLIPANTLFIGYARSSLTIEDIGEKIRPYVRIYDKNDENLFEKFLKKNVYIKGSYDNEDDFKQILPTVLPRVDDHSVPFNQLFYLALPPTLFNNVTKMIHYHCMSHTYVFFFNS